MNSNNVQIKGTSLHDLIAFIRNVHSDKYQTWFDNLSEEAKLIFGDVILNSNYYDLYYGHIHPLEVMGDVCYDGERFKGSYECGKYGCLNSLKGIYSIFLKIPSLDFVLKKVSVITSTYFKGVDIQLERKKKELILLYLYGFLDRDEIMVVNIAGWIDGLMSLVFKHPYEVSYFKDIEDTRVVYRIAIKLL